MLLQVAVLVFFAAIVSTSGQSCPGACGRNVRLQGGTASRGRLEVCVNGSWQTVCNQRFNRTDATIACRELGFSENGATIIYKSWRTTSASQLIWTVDTQCTGNEESLMNCSQVPLRGEQLRHCTAHKNDVGITCQWPVNEELRIIGGPSRNEGRLEVFVNNKWGTVCDDYWSKNDAKVACRQLKFSDMGARALRYGFNKRSMTDNTPIWLDNLTCDGSEMSLVKCNHNGIGKHNCDHTEDAGISCREVSRLEKFLRAMMKAEIEKLFETEEEKNAIQELEDILA